MTQFHNTKVVRNEIFSPNLFLLELEFPKDSNFEFRAGQYVLVYKEINEKEINRAFSIASNPKNKTIELIIRKHDEGELSPRLYELKAGDELKIRGPFGVFQLKEPIKEETIFIAAGTGIAPLRSMIYELLENNPEKKATLLFGISKEKDFFLREEFEKLKGKHPNFNLILTISHPPSDYEGHKGRVTAIIPEVLKNNNQDIYICGPKQMINDTLNLLIKDINFKEEQVHIERWGSG